MKPAPLGSLGGGLLRASGHLCAVLGVAGSSGGHREEAGRSLGVPGELWPALGGSWWSPRALCGALRVPGAVPKGPWELWGVPAGKLGGLWGYLGALWAALYVYTYI